MEVIDTMQQKLLNKWLLCCTTILCLFAATADKKSYAATPDGLAISPQILAIDGFFSGSMLKVSGTIELTEDVIIEVIGKDAGNSFDLKGRIGPFWMTKGNIRIENIPELYLLMLPEGQSQDKKYKIPDIGIDHLKKRMSTNGTIESPPDIFDMFAGLKTAQGLYKEVPDAVNYTVKTDGTKRFEATCRLPALIETGLYEVVATIVSEKGKGRQMKNSFSVEQVGFVKLIDNLASNRRILYGVTAVVIALAAGLIMGILFRQGEGGH